MLGFVVEIVAEDFYLSKVWSICCQFCVNFPLFLLSHTLTYIETEENKKLNQL